MRRACGLALALSMAPFTFLACSDDGGTSPEGGLTISPATADIATCRTRQFTADPADGVTWSVTGEGVIDEDGLYAAPIQVPAPASATIEAERDGDTASAKVTLATAFPEKSIDIGRVETSGRADFVHPVAASGSRVYALLEDDDGPNGAFGGSLAIVRSDDGGLTWGAPVGVGGGNRSPAVAIDAGDPDTVYVTLHSEDDAGVGTLLLATSTDGGATFTTKPLYIGGTSETQDADVVSGKPGSVTVAAPAVWLDSTTGAAGATLFVWTDDAKGAGFGAPAAIENGYDGQAAPGLELRLGDGRLIETNEGRTGPQLATNGAGMVCLTSSDYALNGGEESLTLRCSKDAGATFGDAVPLVTGPSADQKRARVAVGPDGKLIAVVYNGFDDETVDELGKTHYLVSTDGGVTFGADKTLHDVEGDSGKLGVYDAEVAIDGAGVIWFVRTVDTSYLEIDKSCDGGETMSGAIALEASNDLTRGFVFESSAGLFAAGLRGGDTGSGLTMVRLIAK